MRNPDFVVGPSDNPYMNRWWILPRNKWFNIYLHEFKRSDDDEALHDHPWWNISIVLCKGYWEHMPVDPLLYRDNGFMPSMRRLKKEWRGPGSIVFRSALTAHRLSIDEQGTWSLFITGRTVRKWGFLCPKGWVFWKDFVIPRDGGNSKGRGCGEP